MGFTDARPGARHQKGLCFRGPRGTSGLALSSLRRPCSASRAHPPDGDACDLDQSGVPNPLPEFLKARTDDVEVSHVLRVGPELVDSRPTKQDNLQDSARQSTRTKRARSGLTWSRRRSSVCFGPEWRQRPANKGRTAVIRLRVRPGPIVRLTSEVQPRKFIHRKT